MREDADGPGAGPDRRPAAVGPQADLSSDAGPAAPPPRAPRRLPAGPSTAATVDVPALAFSTPYLLLWTAGLEPLGAVGLTLAHAATVLAASAWSALADVADGQRPRLRLVRDGFVPDLARQTVTVCLLAALIGGLLAMVVHPLLALLPAAGLAIARGFARLPLSQRSDRLPVLLAPAGILAAPAFVLWWLTDAAPSPWPVWSGVGCLAAVILARDWASREEDETAGVLTLATRAPCSGLRGLRAATVLAALAALAALVYPLSPGETLTLWVALALLATVVLRRWLVGAIFVLHLLLAASWLLH